MNKTRSLLRKQQAENQSQKQKIQQTLKELHRLQAQIIELKMDDSPHSVAPAKKEIKQLAFLYQNMTKPKTRNTLDVSKEDIQIALQVMEQSPFETPKRRGKIPPSIKKSSSTINTEKLRQIMKSVYEVELDVELMSTNKSEKPWELSAEEIQEFINYNDFDEFDPIEEAYNLYLDDKGRFSCQKYNTMCKRMGMEPIKSQNTFKSTLHIAEDGILQLQNFKKLVYLGYL